MYLHFPILAFAYPFIISVVVNQKLHANVHMHTKISGMSSDNCKAFVESSPDLLPLTPPFTSPPCLPWPLHSPPCRPWPLWSEGKPTVHSNLSIRTADAGGSPENRTEVQAQTRRISPRHVSAWNACGAYVLYCMCSFFAMILAQWESVWCSSRVQRIVFRLPYETLRVVPMQQNYSKNTEHNSCELRTINNTQYNAHFNTFSTEPELCPSLLVWNQQCNVRLYIPPHTISCPKTSYRWA